MTLKPHFSEQRIRQLLLLHREGEINLEPGFQRDSVWTKRDRERLIQSILSGKPIPNIFLYRRTTDRGTTLFDVIDGKQRLETIFRFVRASGFKRDGFDVRLDIDGSEQRLDWRRIEQRYPVLRSRFESYSIQIVEIEGDLDEIIDVFLSINSTGKRLTSGEKRHARFYRSPFLLQAQKLTRTYRSWVLEQRIVTQAQFDRMKAVELFSELLMSIHSGGILNKKTSLDRAIGNDSINAHSLRKAVREFKATMNMVRKKFPRLRETRLRNSAEFYSLFMLIWQMRQAHLALTDRRADELANHLLRQLSTGVDELRAHLRRASIPKEQDKVYAEYLLTIQGDTDSSASRERRQAILKSLLWSLYKEKDRQRLFTLEQRRILWHKDAEKLCSVCEGPVTWDEVSIDHIVSHARGGRTSLENAALTHKSCNSRKGTGDARAVASRRSRSSRTTLKGRALQVLRRRA